MILSTRVGAFAAAFAFVALLQDNASAATLTRKPDYRLQRRQEASPSPISPNPGRGAGCGRIRNNVQEASVRGQCVCFNPNNVAIFGETPAAVTFANDQGYIFPTSVCGLRFMTRVVTGELYPVALNRQTTMASRTA